MAGACYLMKLFARARMSLIATGWLFALLRVQAAETSLIPFELEGHDKQTYTASSWAGRPLLVFVSTREAAAHNAGRAWSGPVTAAVTGHAADAVAIRVGTLPHDVPRLFASMVRNALEPASDDPIRIALLDWEGRFAQHYELDDESYNVLLFDRDGELVYRVALRDFAQEKLDIVLRDIEATAGRL